jgi:hypothetical protein
MLKTIEAKTTDAGVLSGYAAQKAEDIQRSVAKFGERMLEQKVEERTRQISEAYEGKIQFTLAMGDILSRQAIGMATWLTDPMLDVLLSLEGEGKPISDVRSSEILHLLIDVGLVEAKGGVAKVLPWRQKISRSIKEARPLLERQAANGPLPGAQGSAFPGE